MENVPSLCIIISQHFLLLVKEVCSHCLTSKHHKKRKSHVLTLAEHQQAPGRTRFIIYYSLPFSVLQHEIKGYLSFPIYMKAHQVWMEWGIPIHVSHPVLVDGRTQ